MKTSVTSNLLAETKRRCFFEQCGLGIAGMAAGALLHGRSAFGEKVLSENRSNPLAPKEPHFPPSAKRVIYLFHAGAPSQLELFDHKPELAQRDGQLPPRELLDGYRAAFIDPKSASWVQNMISNLEAIVGWSSVSCFHTSKIADEICLIRSMHTDAVNHAPGQIMMNTGSEQFGRPSFGSWTLYGLGSESQNLPGFVVLTSAKGTSGGASNYGCGFLPTLYGGTPFRSVGDPVLYLQIPRNRFDFAAGKLGCTTGIEPFFFTVLW